MRWPTSKLGRARIRTSRPGWRLTTMLVLTWLLVAVPVGVVLFLNGSRATVLAGHDAVVRPSLDGWATLNLGPYLPDLRYPAGGRLGARIDLGKTTADSYQVLVQRYAFIASQPEGQIRKVRSALVGLARDSAVEGVVVGLAGPGLVLLVGVRRWREIGVHVTVRRAVGCVLVVVLVLAVAERPWDRAERRVEQDRWTPLATALPEVRIPQQARPLQIDSGLITDGTRRLVSSAVDTYWRSLRFYQALVKAAPALRDQLHQPGPDERVGLLVADRHDNIGMDPVARAIADQGKADFLLDAGDDTSTGGAWEAFSLESLSQAFEGIDPRFQISGNHDHGDIVTRQAEHLGFTTLVGSVVRGPAGLRILGVSDPRSSGLGTWRDERGITFDEQERRLADLSCRADANGDRIDILMVHDANSGRRALARGCVGVVLAGHVHEQIGPTEVTGANGKVGYTYTNGTTGGAAYALAIGSKLRRDAEVTLVTVRDGAVRGLQPIIIDTLGTFRVAPYLALRPTASSSPRTP